MPEQLKSEVVSLPTLVTYGGVGRLLIERYQRPYAWGSEEIETLFQDHFLDIPARIAKPKSGSDVDPFIGSIVLLSKKSNELGLVAEVIDGQQRLTTLTLILAMAARRLEAEGEAIPKEVSQVLFVDDELRVPRLVPKEQDRGYYNRAICLTKPDSEVYEEIKNEAKQLKDSNPEELDRPSFCVFKILRDCLQGYMGEAKVHEVTRKQALRALVDSIMNHVRIVVVAVDGYSQGMAVFESLNARGQPLTVDQLFKNLLMLTFTKEFDHEMIEEKWEKGAASFETCFPKPEHRDKFLMYYHRAFFGHIQKRLLYASFRRIAQATKSGGDGSKFESLKALLDHMSDNWRFVSKFNGPIKSLGGEIFRPALMAVREKFKASPDDVEEALSRAAFLFEAVLVRVQVCKSGIGRLDSNMSHLCEKLLLGEFGETPASVEKGIKEFFRNPALGVPDDQYFKSSLISMKCDLRGRREGLVFARLHQEAEGVSQFWQYPPSVGDFSYSWSDQPMAAPSQGLIEARDYDEEEQYHALIHSLGNVVILPPKAQKAGAFQVNTGVPTTGAKKGDIQQAGRTRAERLIKIYRIFPS